MEYEKAIKAAWLEGFEYGVDVAGDLASEAHRSRIEHWDESETNIKLTETRTAKEE